jgi:Na+/pantothenate symporter
VAINWTLAELLNLSGALVASAIWPIAAGLYWRRTNRLSVTLAMVLGSVAGLVAYYTIGWYVSALVGAAISMVIVLVSTWLWPCDFDWQDLQEGHS